MSKFSKLIRSIKDKLSGTEMTKKNHAGEPSETNLSKPNLRAGYFIQIGLDYGTSFSKCICRDVFTDKAWIHVPPYSAGHELPFLIPSALLCMDGKLSRVTAQDTYYPQGGLYHLKRALVEVALGQLGNPVLEPYRRVCNTHDDDHLCNFVESCAVYYLAGVLGTVRNQVRQRMPDFGKHPQDYMAVNLAVPVADAQQPQVEKLYNRVLCQAWLIADEMSGLRSIELNELDSLRQKGNGAIDQSAKDACFIYPEVSANVQGFVRSRVASEGMYLFSDTGAATVDQSVFIFFRRSDSTEHLTYLHGNVLPCGSSCIEFEAARISGNTDPHVLEIWREKKERGSAEHELIRARNMLRKSLEQGTTATLASAKKKLYIPDGINKLRLIFGGGGHCKHPYENSVISPFSGHLFRQSVKPDIVGLPIPGDLELEESQRNWMNRLAVAYGLSYHKENLTGFTYPRDVKDPESQQIWPKRRDLPDFISKDQC